MALMVWDLVSGRQAGCGAVAENLQRERDNWGWYGLFDGMLEETHLL